MTNCTARVLRKLGLASRVELAFAPPVARRVAALTEAEHDVLVDLLGGSTNRDIAARRGSSERTVANQVQSIYRKLGVRSRAELAVSMQRREAA